jgi:hypothetical protein
MILIYFQMNIFAKSIKPTEAVGELGNQWARKLGQWMQGKAVSQQAQNLEHTASAIKNLYLP